MNRKASIAARGFGSMACAAAAVTAMCPTLAFASEEASGGIDAILPQMDEFIPMLIAFLILWFILAKFGWPMFNGMLEKREQTIKDSIEKSEQARIESERTLEEYKRQLEEARGQAATIVAEAKRSAEIARASITEKAQEESEAMIEKARHAIELEKRAAISELKGVVVDTSMEVVARVVDEDLNDDEHRRIIERYVNEAGSFNAN